MDLATIVGVGGPLAGISTLLGFFLKAYLDKRGADREDVRVDRESESGIVETTKLALTLAREEMKEQNARREAERAEYREEMARVREENRCLREELAALRNPP